MSCAQIFLKQYVNYPPRKKNVHDENPFFGDIINQNAVKQAEAYTPGKTMETRTHLYSLNHMCTSNSSPQERECGVIQSI